MLLPTLPRPPHFVPLPPEVIETNLAAAFERQVALLPDALAVADDERSLTYTELNRLANRIAFTILQAAGPPPVHPANSQELAAQAVAIHAGHNVLGVAAMLGVLKAGRFLVYLDTEDPPARLERLRQDCHASLILSDSAPHAAALRSVNARVLRIDELEAGLSDQDPGLPLPPDAISLLIYTSGSTGAPKGVIHTHRNFLHAAWSENLHSAVSSGDRCGVVLSLGFGGSLLQVFSTLTLGAELHLFDLRQHGIEVMPEWFRQKRITFSNITATTLRQFCHAAGPGADFPDLRLVLTGGETVYPRDVALFRATCPPHTFLRLGGGTSEALWVAECFVDSDGLPDPDVAPFGYLFPDKEVLIWDETGQPVAPGETGEIVVRSRYLSPGYWGQPDLTHQVYLPDPHEAPHCGDAAGRGDSSHLPPMRLYRSGDLGRWLPGGLLEHLGRKDYLLKVRGMRIDPGEIEAALLGLPGVLQAAVAGKPDRAGETRLVAYLVLQPEAQWTAESLQRALGERLPQAMLPARYVFLEALPLSAARKVDRSALPNPPDERPTLAEPYAEPATPIEKNLAHLWGEILEIDRVGANDDYVALGGDSLRAMRILGRLNSLYPVSLNLRQFLEAQTVRKLAALVAADIRRQIEEG